MARQRTSDDFSSAAFAPATPRFALAGRQLSFEVHSAAFADGPAGYEAA